LLPDPDETRVCGAGADRAARRATRVGKGLSAMQFMTQVLTLLSALAASALGCSVAVSPSPPDVVVPANAGTLTVRWLVAGGTDPATCDAYGATTMEVVVYDASGAEIAKANAPCSAFAITIPLPDGTYSAEATLIDPGSNARSVTKPLHGLEVVSGTDLAVDLDFPTTSIL
jgi:hypothetical protein